MKIVIKDVSLIDIIYACLNNEYLGNGRWYGNLDRRKYTQGKWEYNL